MLLKKLRTSSGLASVCIMALVNTSCGNAWITTSERENSIAGLMQTADYAYDKLEFAKASEHYRKALELDPTMEDTMIKLAYSINGEAGLTILDFVANFLKSDSSQDTQLAENNNPLSLLTNTVGLSQEDIDAIVNAETPPTSIADIRALSKRFQKLQESWLVICKVMPKNLFDTVFESETEQFKELFGLSSCQDGLEEGRTASSAALFAAGLQFMAQAAGLYQTILDSNGDGEVDLVSQGTRAVNELEQLRSQSAAAADGQAIDTSALAAINARLDTLQDLQRQITEGELITYSLTCFSLVAALIASIESIPDQVAANIDQSIERINSAQTTLTQYTGVNSSSNDAEQGKKVKEALGKASQTVDNLYQKVDALPAGEEKDKKRQELDENVDEVCSNFEETKDLFNLPADTERPQKCGETVTALTGSTESSRDTVATPRGRVFKRIPLISERTTRPHFDDSPVNLQEFQSGLIDLINASEELAKL